MPEIKNTFLKAKMNKDLDDRLVPNGEYRDAQNLQISRSEGSSVGEFENIPGNSLVSNGYLETGSIKNTTTGAIISYNSTVIGQYTDESTGNIFIFSTTWNPTALAIPLPADTVCPRDITVYTKPIAVAPSGDSIALYDASGVLLNPLVLGVEDGMSIWGPAVDGATTPGDIYVTAVTNTDIRLSWNPDGIGTWPLSTAFTIGWGNTIHVWNANTRDLQLLVRGGFLNFSTQSKIYGINLLENLLFWTDNRNQPRRINVDTAIANAPSSLFLSSAYYTNEDQISVAKYYPYEVPLVLDQNILPATSGIAATAPIRGYVLTMADTTGIKIGDIVTGFPGQQDQELWEVITIVTDTSVTVYNNFLEVPGTVPPPLPLPGTWSGGELTFSRSTMTNESEIRQENGFKTTPISVPAVYLAGAQITFGYPFTNTVDDPSPEPTPKVGDYITSLTMTGPSGVGITIADEVIIQSIDEITASGAARVIITLTKDIIINALTDDITISANPDYNAAFKGDPDLIEEEFVRFSYRFKSTNNEYSLMAPFSQICFIPKQRGIFGGGPNNSKQDMLDAYSSTIIAWFENRINNIKLKIPLPSIEARNGSASTTTAGAIVAGTSISISLLTETIEVGDIITSLTPTVTIPINTTVTGGNLLTTITLSNDVTLVNPTNFSFSPNPLTSLQNDYQVEEIEILYKESDALATKVLESINVTNNITLSDISSIPSTSTTQYYYTFDYKSIKPYITLPQSQTTRVYDKVPIKALAQEIVANRITYGNYIENHTPPVNLDYEIILDNKSISYDNYAQYPNHSVKQNRNYQVGFVLSDRYGRQSGVILSTNDSDPALAGSNIYVPYKNWDEIQFGELSTYEWLGNVLRVKVNNGIAKTTATPETGTPGLYKSYSDTDVDNFTISNGGAAYAIGDSCTTAYPALNVGLGSGFTFDILTVVAGVITGITITNRGTGYADSQVLNVVGGTGAGAEITVTINPPNILGWQSYKCVVKQQEQEYYNVYFPGFVSGYPVIQALERGRVAFASLFSDNINKVPRDLNEVGPLQNEFSASVILYGRVNNPNINNKGPVLVPPSTAYYQTRELPWNTQYFPGRIADEVVTIGPIGYGGLEIANSPFVADAKKGMFANATVQYDPATGIVFGGAGASTQAQLPWGHGAPMATTVGPAEKSFFNVEQNPLAVGIKVGDPQPQPQLTHDDIPILNTLGAYVTNQVNPPIPLSPVATMIPFLSVSETEPIESILDIFWESSTSGSFIDLNRSVTADYAGVSSMSSLNGIFSEDKASGYIFASSLEFEDSAGNQLTLDTMPQISTVRDDTGSDVTLSNLFVIEQDPAEPALKGFQIKTNSTFWYGDPATNVTSYLLSFTTSYSGGQYIDILPDIYTVTLKNDNPNNLNFVSTLDAAVWTTGQTVIPTFTNLATSIGTFSGDNGSVDVGGKLNELCWSVVETAAPGGSTAVFSIDSSTGVVTVTGGSLSNGAYTITGTLIDAAPACASVATSLSTDCIITFTVGTPPTDRAICFGEVSDFYLLNATASCTGTGSGEPLEVFFGANQFVNNANLSGSNSQAYLATLPGTSWGSRTTTLPSDLAYYNVLAEALGEWSCLPGPATPAFTTGALTQGEMVIKPRLVKQTATALDYLIKYTIIYRTGPLDIWQQATCDVGSPAQPAGGAVGTWIQLDVSGTGVYPANPTGEDSDTYIFSAPGEYVAVGYYITGPGCGVEANGADFRVDFYDENMNEYDAGWTDACTDCLGPL